LLVIGLAAADDDVVAGGLHLDITAASVILVAVAMASKEDSPFPALVAELLSLNMRARASAYAFSLSEKFLPFRDAAAAEPFPLLFFVFKLPVLPKLDDECRFMIFILGCFVFGGAVVAVAVVGGGLINGEAAALLPENPTDENCCVKPPKDDKESSIFVDVGWEYSDSSKSTNSFRGIVDSLIFTNRMEPSIRQPFSLVMLNRSANRCNQHR
jgi:hypothetical protein